MVIRASGGFCAPINCSYDFPPREGIWANRIQLLSRWRRWFSWDKGWGFPLRGGPAPKLMDMLEPFRAQRGGVKY